MKFLNFKCVMLMFLACLMVSASWARNLSPDVEALVKSNLAKDDYNVFFKEAAPESVLLGTKEVSTVNGLNAKRIDGLAFFFIDDKIKRFDMAPQVWLDDLELISPFTSAFIPDDFAVYVAHNRSVYRYDYSGNQPPLVHTFANDVDEMLIVGDYLLVISDNSDMLTTIDTSNLQIADQKDTWSGFTGATVTEGDGNSVYGRSVGISPSDIKTFDILSGGVIGPITDSPYHGDYPTANKVYPFPNGARVVDSSGIVYFDDLTYSASLAGGIDHIDFNVDLPIVMRGGSLYAYSNTFLETGTYQLNESKDLFFIYDDEIHLFDYNITEVGHETLAFSELGPMEPGEPINPIGLAYSPDAIEYNGADDLYILSRNNLTIFTYNVSSQSYTNGFALLSPPLFMSYSPVHEVIYLAYADGRITKIDPSTGTEEAFVNSPQMPCGLEAADNHLVICDPSGAWLSHFVYNSDGILLSQEEWSYYSEEYIWNSQNRSLYFYRDDTSPNDILKRSIGLNGVLGDTVDSPYHGGVGTTYPLCVNPNGLNVVLGSGQRYDALSLERLSDDLPEAIQGCAWSRGILYTFDDGINTNLQSWDDKLVANDENSWVGEPIDLIALTSGALVSIFNFEGIPQFRLHNDVISTSGFESIMAANVGK